MKYPTQRHLPSIVNLNTFEVIARRLSITAAADELGLTQSAVSRQLSDLEGFVGVALCRRTTSGMELTVDGASYLRRVRTLLDELESATIAASMGSMPGKILRLSVPTTFGRLWAMPRLCAFAIAHRQIQLDVATHTGPISMRDSGLDAAIVYCEGPEPGCVADLLHPLHSFPLAAPTLSRLAAPLTGTQMAALPLLHQSMVPNSWPAYLRQLGASVEVPMPGAHYGLLSLALTAAEAGLGVALVPDYVSASALQTGRLVKLNDKPFISPRSYFLVTTNERAKAPVIQSLRQWLTSQSPPSP
ncbi:LysR substrate-binding domain-containing protein [Polaromonas aquatica]|uniref:LysR substrate-binding domain-containing protein n=1 Tax=Polaromonas aquatica TaxID=332657 RepID=UPI003D64BE8A